MQPIITTFASNKNTLTAAIKAGADHIILEDSKLALRSFQNDIDTPHFNKIAQLAKLARALNPNIQLSVNIDILFQAHHIPLLNKLIPLLKQAQITHIRIQDIGLIAYIQSRYPQAHFHYAQEPGITNHLAAKQLHAITDQLLLSHELSFKDLQNITSNTPAHYEILVEGRIPLHISYRQYLSALKKNKNKNQEKIALITDHDHPKRPFTCYETPHGTVILSDFNRSLLGQLEKLISLNLTSWLIDGRGQNDAYLITAIQSYKKALQKPTQKKITRSDIVIKKLKKSAALPLKTGFFVKNHTDQTFKKQTKITQNLKNHTLAGIVSDVIKNKQIIVSTKAPIKKNDTLLGITPEGKHIPLPPPLQIRTLDNTSISHAETNQLIILNWIKFITPQTKLYRLK